MSAHKVLLDVVPRDPSMGITCWMCHNSGSEYSTSFEISTDDPVVTVMELCVEHLDGLVNAVLQRHIMEVSQGNPMWFTEPDTPNQEEEDGQAELPDLR